MKSLFKSKTFWFNLLAIATDISQVLPIPMGVMSGIGAVNILLRTVTKEPVKIMP